jgi:4-amino-4-deoxychorismate lyase
MWLMLNGRLVDERTAQVSVFDHGFMYGVGLFETLRIEDGHPILLEQHVQRLHASAEQIGIEGVISIDEASAQIKYLVDANQLRDAYLRISVSAGVAPLGLPNQPYQQPTTIMYMKSLAPAIPFATRPAKALQLLRLRRNSPESNIRYKSFHYLNNIMGKQECNRYPWTRARETEGLFLNEAAHLTEGIVSNLFFVKQDHIYTPSIETGVLPGVTRALVIDLAEQAGITLHEGRFSIDDLLSSEEVFLTNSIQEIVAVDTLWQPDGQAHQWPVGPMTTQLAERYDQWKRVNHNET